MYVCMYIYTHICGSNEIQITKVRAIGAINLNRMSIPKRKTADLVLSWLMNT